MGECATSAGQEPGATRDTVNTHLTCPAGVLRPATPQDTSRTFEHKHEPSGDWIIEHDGGVVATGGALFHYNPPYGDLYMEVHESHRRRGYGSYLIQELKRICYETGKLPAARCNVTNTASRKTLEKAGLLPCGHILLGEVRT